MNYGYGSSKKMTKKKPMKKKLIKCLTEIYILVRHMVKPVLNYFTLKTYPKQQRVKLKRHEYRL